MALPPGPAQITVRQGRFPARHRGHHRRRPRAAGHRRADRAARSRRRGGGRRHHPHRPAPRRPADPRRGPGPRGDRREDAHDARRHRHDAQRDGRPAGAGDVAVDRRGQRAGAGHEGPLHALPERRTAALRPAGRRARAAADPADGSRPGRGDQGHGLGALRRRARWAAWSTCCRGARARAVATDALVNLSSLGGADGVGFVAGPLGEHWSASLLASGHSPVAQRSRRRRLGRRRRLRARGRAAAAVLGRRQRPIGVRDGRRVARGSRGRHDVGRGARGHRAAVHRGARHPPLRRRRHRADAAAQSLRADGAGGSRVAAPRSSLRRRARTRPARHGVRRSRDPRRRRPPHLGRRGGLRARRLRSAGRAALRLCLRRAGVFAQDDVDLASWLSLSAGARVDFHDEYGTFFSPRAGDADPRRRMDEPLRRRAGLLRGDAADRGDRGGRAHAPDRRPARWRRKRGPAPRST